MRDIGKNIKDLRRQKGLTQEELAEKLFVTRQTISNYEQGRTRPDIDMLVTIAEALDADANTILYGIPAAVGKQKNIRSVCITVVMLILSLVLYSHLADWAQEYKIETFNAMPVLWIRILIQPLVAFQFGWTVMQLAGVFTQLRPVIPRKWAFWGIFSFVLLYLLLMLPFLAMPVWPWQVPRAWAQAVYYLLDALPARSSTFSNTFWGFLLGIIIPLCRKK